MQLAPRRLAVLITLLGPLALPACGGAPQLDGAVYAAQIPVYPKAKLRDVGGGNYYEDIGGQSRSRASRGSSASTIASK